MRTVNRVDTSTLGWVKSEIDQTLDQAREALQRYVEGSDDLTPLRLFANSVHQVAGTLQMVELDGAAQLAQETESLASAVVAGRVGKNGSPVAGELLGGGIDHLSSYMERLANGLPDRPIDNVDVINELRRARHAEELDPYSLFHPDLEVYPTKEQPAETATQAPGGEPETDQFRERVRDLRREFQAALLRWLRDQHQEDAWESMAEVVTELYELSRFQVSLQVWWVARAYLDVLKAVDLGRDDPRKHPLAKLDQLMRKLSEDSEATMAREGPEKVVRYMLYQIGRSGVGTEATRAVIHLFELDTLLGVEDAEPLPGADRLASIRERAAEPLRFVQSTLEQYSRKGDAGDTLAACEQRLNDIATAARDAGVDEIADVCTGVGRVLFEDGAKGHSEEALLTAARALLFVDQSLNDPERISGDWRREAAAVMRQLADHAELSDTPSMAIESAEVDADTLEAPELRRLVAAVANQIGDNLKEAEENLERFAKDTADMDSLSGVGASLRQVHGAVRMLGRHKLCDLLELALARIDALSAGDAVVTEPVMDALAVSIGTTDAYMKGMERGAPNIDALLTRAMQELEQAEAGAGAAGIDPHSTLKSIQDSFDVWIGDNEDYEAFRTLRRSLRDIGALASDRDQLSLQRIAQEMVNLLDIVTDDPSFLSDEVEKTLRRSLATLNDLAARLAPVSGEGEAMGDSSDPEAVDIDDEDEVVRETFIEEAHECLEEIDRNLEVLRRDHDDTGALADARRSFHTIKGSGRMVRAADIAELAWIVEDVLNGCMDGDLPVSDPVIELTSEASAALRSMLAEGLDSSADLPAWRRRARALRESAAEEPVAGESPPGDIGPSAQELVQDNDGPAAAVETSSAVDLQETPAAARRGFTDEVPASPGTPAGPAAVRDAPASRDMNDLGEDGHPPTAREPLEDGSSPFSDDEVIKIFSKEALSHIASIRRTMDECHRRGEASISDELLRAVHTLQGNARSLHLVEMSEAYTALDRALNARKARDAGLYERETEVLDALLISTAKVLDHLNRDKRFPDVVRKELVEIAEEIEQSWSGDGSGEAGPASTGAPETATDFGGDHAEGFERTDTAAEETPLGESAGVEGEMGGEEETEAAKELEVEEAPVTDQDSEHQTGTGSVFDQLAEQRARTGSDARVEGGVAGDDRAGPIPSDSPDTPDTPVQPAEPQAGEAFADEDRDMDIVLRDVFVEEAADILSRFESTLQQGRGAGLDSNLANTLKRELHTLKGSARAAGMEAIGDLSHDAESMLEGVSDPARSSRDRRAELLALLEEVHDSLASMVQGLEEGRSTEADARLLERLRSGSREAAAAGARPAVPLIPEEGTTAANATEPSGPRPTPVAPDGPPEAAAASGAEESSAPERGPGEALRPAARSTVRIRSNVLDKLVNYAGEVSISRSQLEEQLSGLKGNLNELRANVARFSDQVRELDIQADTQIRSRVAEEQISEAGHDFDPLEMDRYSRLQQLSRSLSESVDDLVTIQTGLNRFASRTEGMLSQQALLNSELQDGLMSARMVPFNTLVPRLRHQARQTARELGKEVDFFVTGAEIEVDRNILDQLSEALEHMIRNSLDHGIESASARRAAGKPVRGSVRIDCRQEGNEVVLKFSDDGAGLDVDRIKTRAVEAGLLGADSDLSDDEIIQLIVLSGFSTAESVTQLSGRGVGLDVVNDAVRRLGGSLTMDNRPGAGVSFELRLPLSLSITRAMFVRCGGQRFAIPLGVIETVLKTEPENLVELSKDGDPLFRQNDRVYTLMDLTAALGLEPVVPGKRVPVLLVRMGARDVAVRVDDLIETDEIVVKQLGDHLGRLPGINGATITGDGSVVLILDLAALWLAQERMPAVRHEAPRQAAAMPKVMVVDDSLTVRKVTGRNLGRHGMEVIMARDGIDALDQLANGKPDLMLVDIEMPRMDGYELTTRIREDVNYRDIPIIVITSRAGAKHRERAMALGANAYLTKPYQERELLEEVKALLQRVPQSTVH
ncbi:MAG: Hpt domain-containing protein [Arenicellales bacterium]